MVKAYWELFRLQMEQVDNQQTLVVIPLGAMEQHGNQAPLGTDSMIAEDMSERVLRLLAEEDLRDHHVLFFQTIPVGYSVEHQNFCGTVTFRLETYYHVLYDLVAGLHRHGFMHVAFIICHGGNRAMAEIVSRQVRQDFGAFVYLISSGSFSHPEVKVTISPGNEADFHGGEMESAMVMARDEKWLIYQLPELVITVLQRSARN